MSDKEKKQRWKLVLNIATVVALAALVYVVRGQLSETLRNLHTVQLWAVLLIIPIEMLNYDAYARMYRSFFGLLGVQIKYREMLKVALELNMVNHVFPSGGVSGFSYFSLRLRQFDISAAKATLVQTMKFVFLFLSFEVLIVLGLLFLAVGGRVNNFVTITAGSLATLVLGGTLLLGYIVGSKERIDSFFTYVTRLVNRLINFVWRQHPETINISRVRRALLELHENYGLLRKSPKALKRPFFNAFVANFTEVAALYVIYIAFGHWVNPGAVILAYAVANFAGLVSVLPGGVGIYEALMTAVLAAAGIPPAISLPVTVMYRVINMTIQIVPGYYFYHKALHTKNE
jgi:uncharacterized protein (TIRG00374 family)